MPSLSPVNPAFSLRSFPHPPDPRSQSALPRREGGDFLFSYARGFAPCIPGTEPEATLGQGGEPRTRRGACLPCCRLTLPLWYPEGGGEDENPNGTCSPCPGGEDHLKRRSSSPPVPPLLGCRHCPKKGGSVCFAPKHKLPSALGACLAGTISAAGGLMQGCRGRSPRRNKLKISPLPAGKGGRGDGGRK